MGEIEKVVAQSVHAGLPCLLPPAAQAGGGMAGTGGGEREDEAFFLTVEALQTLFAGLDGAVDGEEGIVGVTGLAATIDGHPPPAVGGVLPVNTKSWRRARLGPTRWGRLWSRGRA